LLSANFHGLVYFRVVLGLQRFVPLVIPLLGMQRLGGKPRTCDGDLPRPGVPKIFIEVFKLWRPQPEWVAKWK